MPFVRAVTPTPPTPSLAVDPVSVEIRAPVVPLNRYTAPALEAAMESVGAVTTTLPLERARTLFPNPLPEAEPGLISWNWG